MTRLFFLSIFLVFATAFADDPVRGILLDDEDDAPIAYVDVVFLSGKSLAATDSRGRFEFMVPVEDAVLVFRKVGYSDLTVRLAEYPDNLDLELYMKRSARDLGEKTVRSTKTGRQLVAGRFDMNRLEDVSGMNFDLNEQLSGIPGVSGQQEFRSDISYEGSRSDDVSHVLGGFRIPAMRHLDIGFPGNLSVINPQVLQAVQVNDRGASGPLDQGLATALEYRQREGNPENFDFRTSLGTVVREGMVTGPWIFWDAFVFSFRWLDPSPLESMGQKFFTEYGGRDAPKNCEGEDCPQVLEDPFTLKASDFYLHLTDHDSLGGKQSITAVFSSDKYLARQQRDLSNSEPNALFEGSQTYNLVSWESRGAEGGGAHLGWFSQSGERSLNDTAEFRFDAPDSTGARISSIPLRLDKSQKDQSIYSAGFVSLLDFSPFGGETDFALDAEWRDESRGFSEKGGTQKAEQTDKLVRSDLRWKRFGKGGELGLSAGVLTNLGSLFAPAVSVDLDRKSKDGLPGYFTGLALRSQYRTITGENYGTLEGKIYSSAGARLGSRWQQGGFEATVTTYGKYYPEPTLPEPDAFWYNRELERSENAWVSGANLNLSYRSLHHVAFSLNVSRVYGEYALKSRNRKGWEQEKNSLPWEANRSIDAVSRLRWYPRYDSLISIILTHRATAGSPLYSWNIVATARNDATPETGDFVNGQRSIRKNLQTLETYRTDLRVHLDLKSSLRPLKNLRFFFEVDNLFAALDMSALKFLGGDNLRQRFWTTSNPDGIDDNRYVLDPFLARGMGFFVQFGMEGNFGF